MWATLRQSGYTDALGFVAENLSLYVDFVRWLAREELRLFTHGIAGRVSTEKAARMAEEGITLVNQILGLLRKTTLLKYIAEGNVPPTRARRPRAG